MKKKPDQYYQLHKKHKYKMKNILINMILFYSWDDALVNYILATPSTSLTVVTPICGKYAQAY